MDAPSRSPLAKATAAQRDWTKKPQPPRNISPMAARVVGLDTRSPRSGSVSPKPARLVSSRQRWAHSVCSKRELEAALQDDSITAIETDLIWSTTQSAVVHAHPPQTNSDLAFDAFMDAVTTSPQRKHLKLDFKSLDVVQPVIWGMEKYYAKALQARGQHVWLNADVLIGPGSSACAFDADAFVQACSRHRAFSSLTWLDRGRRIGPQLLRGPRRGVTVVLAASQTFGRSAAWPSRRTYEWPFVTQSRCDGCWTNVGASCCCGRASASRPWPRASSKKRGASFRMAAVRAAGVAPRRLIRDRAPGAEVALYRRPRAAGVVFCTA